MIKITIYQVDAFTRDLFGGNPAAVCPLNKWLPDELMQKIAMENNLADTAFIVPEGDHFRIRWFTPALEVDLCGHATLASAFVYYTQLGFRAPEIFFESRSGILKVTNQSNGDLTLNFPVDTITPVPDPPAALFESLDIHPAVVVKGKTDYLIELPSAADIEALNPDFPLLSSVKARGLVATARGIESDFVSRCFFPQAGIDEDPVTGSAHCLLTAYWHQKTGLKKFSAIQLSQRKGHLQCELVGDRVLITGQAVLYMKGEIFVPYD